MIFQARVRPRLRTLWETPDDIIQRRWCLFICLPFSFPFKNNPSLPSQFLDCELLQGNKNILLLFCLLAQDLVHVCWMNGLPHTWTRSEITREYEIGFQWVEGFKRATNTRRISALPTKSLESPSRLLQSTLRSSAVPLFPGLCHFPHSWFSSLSTYCLLLFHKAHGLAHSRPSTST